MSEELTPFQTFVPVFVNEGRRHRMALAVVFASVVLVALLGGVLWPKKYSASTTILVQESNIIGPLMEGAASTTGVANRAGIAREVIFSRKVLTQVLAAGGWMAAHPTPVEQDRIMESIKSSTRVASSQKDSLITINYSDSDPERAFRVTQQMAALFISVSLASKERESRDAFDFINSQAEAYRTKLTEAEGKLKEYREANADARPGSETDTNTRIGALRTQVETARMDLTELQSKQGALQSQLSGESEVTAVQTRQGMYRSQLADLQAKLDTLLLTYTDQYPDVVRIRHQMQDLQQQLKQDEHRTQTARAAGISSPLDNNIEFNPVYRDLRVKQTAVRSDLAAAGARLHASETMLQSELERSKRIANSENALSELTRDYNVNRDIYQDLLKRRENARVSMNLDAEQRGLTFRIQDPAVLPLIPTGLRFLHFGLAGLFLAIALPVGFLFGIARFDPRVRSAEQLERLTGLAVLATIPYYATPRDRARDRMGNVFAVLMVVGALATCAILFWLKLKRTL
ncbi:MAG: XrtA system polysaccharide chain length determinant [Dokdonella sp.]